MSSINERSCSLLVHYEKPASYNEIKDALEGSDPEAKVLAMKKAVMAILNGEQIPQLFITIVRYVLPSEDHAVQKLLLLYLVRMRLGPCGDGEHVKVAGDCSERHAHACSVSQLGSCSPHHALGTCRRHWRRPILLASYCPKWCGCIAQRGVVLSTIYLQALAFAGRHPRIA